MNILLITFFLPLIGMILLFFFKKEQITLIRNTTLIVSIITFLTSLGLWFGFDPNNIEFQFLFSQEWIKSIGAGFRVGIDGMSLLLIMLTTFLMPLVVLVSFKSIHKREKEYYIMILLLEIALIGVFSSLDLFLFYIFWELILIPMYFIIGIWGGKDRIYASIKFFIFTMVGSLFMLIAIIWIGMYVGNNILETGFTTNFIAIKEGYKNKKNHKHF